MFKYDEVNRCYRVIGIDPGSHQLGIAVVDMDLYSLRFHVVHIETVVAKNLIGHLSKEVIANAGERTVRNYACRDHFSKVIEEFKPKTIAFERPFIGKFFNAFRCLTEHLTLLNTAVFEYDPTMITSEIPPTLVKSSVGAADNSKPAIRKALLDRTDVTYPEGVDSTKLDEHSVDAICVAITQLKVICEVFNLGGS